MLKECIGYIGKDFLVQLVPMERDVSSLVNVLCTRLVISLLGIWQTQRLVSMVKPHINNSIVY